jgi:hypothetical protein
MGPTARVQKRVQFLPPATGREIVNKFLGLPPEAYQAREFRDVKFYAFMRSNKRIKLQVSTKQTEEQCHGQPPCRR